MAPLVSLNATMQSLQMNPDNQQCSPEYVEIVEMANESLVLLKSKIMWMCSEYVTLVCV